MTPPIADAEEQRDASVSDRQGLGIGEEPAGDATNQTHGGKSAF